MGRDEVHYSSNKVHLVLHPGEDMTWDTWENTVQILQYFFRAWDNVALFFDVVDDWGDVVEVVARGLLTL